MCKHRPRARDDYRDAMRTLRNRGWGLDRCIAATVAIFFLMAGTALGAQVILSWDANTEPTLAGYRIHYGLSSGKYGKTIDVGNVTTYTVTGLEDGRKYFFVCTALDAQGNESGYSNEVVWGRVYHLKLEWAVGAGRVLLQENASGSMGLE